ncbi:hypothetical protein HYV89_01120 [Candidatus Woesearchaeota archaeon]|nr:hypothetical protein [Candidatus Woesearchaeota archaeon]
MGNRFMQKLFDLGIADPDRASAHLEIYLRASTKEELEREFIKRKYSCDCEQFLLPRFRQLYEKDDHLQKRINACLSKFDIPKDIVHSYFTEYGDQPYVLLAFEHPEITKETKDNFREAIVGLMLNHMRDYLEIS